MKIKIDNNMVDIVCSLWLWIGILKISYLYNYKGNCLNIRWSTPNWKMSMTYRPKISAQSNNNYARTQQAMKTYWKQYYYKSKKEKHYNISHNFAMQIILMPVKWLLSISNSLNWLLKQSPKIIMHDAKE